MRGCCVSTFVKMAEDSTDSGDNTTTQSNMFVNFIMELLTSPLNMVLLAICGYLLYKIYVSRRQEGPSEPREPEIPKMKKRDFTLEQLREYDGRGKEGRILMGVNGKVFDVTRGKRFYGPGNFD